jgi:hypothetical protein
LASSGAVLVKDRKRQTTKPTKVIINDEDVMENLSLSKVISARKEIK